MRGFSGSGRRNSRRSARSLLAEESAAEASGRRTRARRRATGIPDSSLIQKEAQGDIAAGRQLRNRNSARRSRDKRLHQEHAFSHAASLLEASIVPERSSLDASAQAVLTAAGARSRSGFIKLEPQRRAVGSRTDTRDEELQRKAREGDEDARRILKNRESARMSRQRRIDAWNIACLRLLSAAAKAETGLLPRAEALAAQSREVRDAVSEARRCQAEFRSKGATALPAVAKAGVKSRRRPVGPSAVGQSSSSSPAGARGWTDASSVGASTVGRLSGRSEQDAASSGGHSPVSRPSSALSQRSRRSDSELSGCDMPLPLAFGSGFSSPRARSLSAYSSHRPSPLSLQQSGGVSLPVDAAGAECSLASIAGNLSRTVHAMA